MVKAIQPGARGVSVMRRIFIQVERSPGGDGTVCIYDMTYLLWQGKRTKFQWREKTVHTFTGKHFQVMVMDTFDEFSEEQCKAMAVRFVNGDYDVYSYATEITTKGKDLLRGRENE